MLSKIKLIKLKDSKKILISLVNWLKFEDTIFCVNGLNKHLSYPNYKIRIIDNNSPNSSLEKLKSCLINTDIISSKDNLGYASGHQINVDFAIKNNFDAIWILNSDLEIQKLSLTHLINAWNAEGNHIFGSVTLKSKSPNIVDFAGGLSPAESEGFSYNIYKNLPYEELPSDEIREVQSVEGSSILIPIELIKNHGFMRKDFFIYGEETDYCFRLRTKGIKSFIVKSSIVIHYNSGSFKNLNNLNWILSYYRRRNFMLFMADHYGWSRKQILNANDKTFSRMRFKLKCMLSRDYRERNKILLWELKGSEHAAKGIRGKIVDPNKFLN